MNALLKQIRIAVAAMPFALLGLVSGCGGGGSQMPIYPYSPLTGVFSDAPVTGLNYRTSSGAAGTTDELGYFNYAPGDVVTFSTGGVMLGTVVPIVTPAGNATITPVDLAGGGTPSTNTLAQLTAQVLATLNSIAVANDIKASLPLASGVFTINQSDATAIFQPLVPSYSPLIYVPPPFLTLYSFPLTGTNPPSIQSQLQAAVTAASGVASATSVADATSNMNQGVNAANVIGTVWSGASTGGGGITGTFYFQPDGNMTGFTSDGNILAGTWAGSTTALAGVQFSLISSAGGNYAGTINRGASSATIDTGTVGGTAAFTITKAVASIPLTNNLYLGGWYGVYTPVQANDVYGPGTPVYLVLSPDGTFSGIMDGNQSNTGIIGGTWNPGNIYGTPVSGIGTGAFLNNTAATFSFNMSTRTGLYLQNGNVVGTIAFSRTGVLAMNSSTFSSPGTPMATLPLTVNITWPTSPQNFHSNFALAISTNVGTYAIRSEANPLGNGPLGNGALTYMMTDKVSVPYYPTGATSYNLSVNPIISGSTNCSITSGASGSLPAASATVSINCI